MGKYFFYSLCLVGLLIPFDVKVTNSVIIVSFILWLFSARENIRANWSIYKGYFFLFISLYLINFPGLVLTENMSSGWGRIESRLTYLVFPLIILFSPIDRKNFRMIAYCFCLGVLLSSLFCLSGSYLTYTELPVDQRSVHEFMYESLLDPLDLHPTYFSLFLSFAIFFLLLEIRDWRKKSRTFLTIAIIIMLYLAGFNLLVQSRASLTAFVLIGISLAGVLFFAQGVTVKKAIATGVFMLSAFFLLYSNERLLSRFNFSIEKLETIIFQRDDDLTLAPSTRSTAAHLRSWYCAYRLLTEDYALFTGYGSGDEKDILEPCYLQHEWVIMASERHNAHNEYLSSLLRNGIVELLLLLCCLLIPLYLSLRHRQLLYASFLLLWMATFLFSTLNLQSAMFFFTLFNALQLRIMLQDQAQKITVFETGKDTRAAGS